MAFGKRRYLVSFLEKDNLKMVVYEVVGDTPSRVFAGQISFSQEILRDAFIADPTRFANQVKIAFNQKPQFEEVDEVVLFIPPDKTFTKAIAAGDNVETFIRSL